MPRDRPPGGWRVMAHCGKHPKAPALSASRGRKPWWAPVRSTRTPTSTCGFVRTAAKWRRQKPPAPPRFGGGRPRVCGDNAGPSGEMLAVVELHQSGRRPRATRRRAARRRSPAAIRAATAHKLSAVVGDPRAAGGLARAGDDLPQHQERCAHFGTTRGPVDMKE